MPPHGLLWWSVRSRTSNAILHHCRVFKIKVLAVLPGFPRLLLGASVRNAVAQRGADGRVFDGRIRLNRAHQRLHLHSNAAHNACAEIDGAHHVAEDVPNASDAVHLSRVPSKSTLYLRKASEMLKDISCRRHARPCRRVWTRGYLTDFLKIRRFRVQPWIDPEPGEPSTVSVNWKNH